MANRDKIFRRKLTALIEWYDPEFKFPTKTAKEILRDLKSTIENSNCPTCGESDEDSDDDEIIKPHKKRYRPKMWTCPACNVTTTTKNRLNHERTDKHKKMLKEFYELEDESNTNCDTINKL